MENEVTTTAPTGTAAHDKTLFPDRAIKTFGDTLVGPYPEESELPQVPDWYTDKNVKYHLARAIDAIYSSIDSGFCPPQKARVLHRAITGITESLATVEMALLHYTA